MKSFIYNLGYYIKETCKIIRLNLFSNVISLLGTGLILFLLGLVFAGTAVGNRLVAMLSNEAEINAYFIPGITKEEAITVVDQIQKLDGVQDARLVSEEEARERMKEVLGEEAKILELFENNPFEAYIQISIRMDGLYSIAERVKALEGIEYIRDNREVLEQIKGITGGIKLLGYLVISAVGITTILIISHMIRQGIYINKEQINTLRLLGAPNGFIGFPYVIFGILLVLGGGILATILVTMLVDGAYSGMSGTLPFLPLPPKKELIKGMTILLPAISVVLGFTGSLVGLSSIREREN